MSANDGLLRQNKYFSNGFEQCSRNNLQNREKFNFGLTFSMNEMVVVRKRLSWMIQIHKLMNVDHNIIMLIDKLILYYIHRYPVFSLFCVDSEWLVNIWIIPDQPWPLVDAKSRVWVTRPRQRHAGLCSAPCCAPRFSTFLPTQFPSKNGKKNIIHLMSLKTGPIVKIVSFRR